MSVRGFVVPYVLVPGETVAAGEALPTVRFTDAELEALPPAVAQWLRELAVTGEGIALAEDARTLLVGFASQCVAAGRSVASLRTRGGP